MLAERYLRRRFQEGREEGREESLDQVADRMSELSPEERLEEIDRLIAERRGLTYKRCNAS